MVVASESLERAVATMNTPVLPWYTMSCMRGMLRRSWARSVDLSCYICLPCGFACGYVSSKCALVFVLGGQKRPEPREIKAELAPHPTH